MKNILVAVDGSNHSERAFEYSLKDAEKLRNQITLLRVVPTLGYAGDVLEEALKEKIARAEEYLEELKEKAKDMDIEIEIEILTGTNVANEIVTYADKNKFDLIVVGSRGKTGLETVQLGSVSEVVVKRSHVPVLVVR